MLWGNGRNLWSIHNIWLTHWPLGDSKLNFRWGIFKLILVVNGWGISCETTLIWVLLDHSYDKSTLVQVMVWCRQATSHYLSQCWPRSVLPCGITRTQWVKGRSIVVLMTCFWNNMFIKILFFNKLLDKSVLLKEHCQSYEKPCFWNNILREICLCWLFDL